jgi:hypothetical protein
MSSEIKPKEIVYIETYPRIGIARVGNSKKYYIGPEIPGRNDTPDAGTADEGFKDKDMKVKRQAARFRVYAFGENHKVLGELNSDNGFELVWEVEVANKKPSYYTFMGIFRCSFTLVDCVCSPLLPQAAPSPVHSRPATPLFATPRCSLQSVALSFSAGAHC